MGAVAVGLGDAVFRLLEDRWSRRSGFWCSILAGTGCFGAELTGPRTGPWSPSPATASRARVMSPNTLRSSHVATKLPCTATTRRRCPSETSHAYPTDSVFSHRCLLVNVIGVVRTITHPPGTRTTLQRPHLARRCPGLGWPSPVTLKPQPGHSRLQRNFSRSLRDHPLLAAAPVPGRASASPASWQAREARLPRRGP